MAKYNRHRAKNDDEKYKKIRYAADDEYVDDEYEEYEDEYDEDLARKRAGLGCLIAFLVFIGIIVGVALYGVFWVKGEIDGKNATATEPVVFDVAPGSGGTIVGNQLEDSGLIGHANIFRFYVRFNGSGSGFQAGRYTLTPGMGYDEIIDTLSEPPPARETMRVTFPEGSTVARFGEIVEEAGLCTAAEFVTAANNLENYRDIAVINRLLSEIEADPELQADVEAHTWMRAEGYLAPNTYEFYTDETPENIVRKLYEQFDKEMTDERYAIMEERELTVRELVTLASMIEEEAGDPANQPGVARVFWNRLRGDLSRTDLARRTLGSDVTFYYIRDWIARDYGGSGDYESVANENPELFYAYHTYDDDENVREGLPIGPISCPSSTAIAAALNPATTAPSADNEEENVENAFYFLTDFYKNYYYAQDFNGHSRNIARMEQMNAQFEADGGDVAAAQAAAEGHETAGGGEAEAGGGDEAAAEGGEEAGDEAA